MADWARIANTAINDYLVAQRAAGTPATAADPRAAANAAFIAKQNAPKPPSATTPGNTTPAPVKVNRENMEQVMLQRFREAGVKDF